MTGRVFDVENNCYNRLFSLIKYKITFVVVKSIRLFSSNGEEYKITFVVVFSMFIDEPLKITAT